MKKINIYDGFTFVTGLSLNNMKGYYTVGRGENDYRADFYGLKSNEGINFKRLISQLKTKQNFKLIYQEYRGEVIKERKAISRYGVVETAKVMNKTVPFTYINEYKQQIETSINCGINKKEDFILNVPHFNFEIDIRAKSIVCGIDYFYYDTEQYRKPVKKTPKKDDFYINDKYVAIKFFSENITDMAFLCQEVYGNSDWYKNNVNEIYIPLLENSKSAEELIWLYENAPDFTLAALNQEILWKHIKIFYNYDTVGKLSFFKDASTQLMRALFAFNTAEKIKYLMVQFRKNQSFIKKIYDALDESISFMGQEQKCQTVFASIITNFCYVDYSTLNFINDIYFIGKNFYVKVNDDQKDKHKYLIHQMYNSPSAGNTNNPTTPWIDNWDQEIEKVSYYPLDIISLVQNETNSYLYVPSLFVKDIVHQEDLRFTLAYLRIGMDMLMLQSSVASLGATSPFWGFLGAVEGALGLGDLAVMANKDSLSKEFLDNWERIYVIGGIATASPFAVATLYKLGGKILASAAKIEMKNFVMSCMMKLMLEYNVGKFTLSTLKIVDYEKIAFSFQYRSVAKELLNNGALFVEGDIKIGNTIKKHFGIVYKGETIKTVTEFEQKSNLLDGFWRLEGKKLTKTLDMLADTIKYERGRMGYVDGLFDAIDVNYKPKGFDVVDVVRVDSNYGKGIISRFNGYQGYFYRNFDANKKIFTFNHGFLEDLPKWVEDVKIPLVEGKGIPTQAYFTLRQMKLMGIAKGEIQTVKMAQIQNLETMGYIYQTMKEKNLVNLASVDILKAPSNEYMKTVMTQAGYEIMSGKIMVRDITEQLTIKELKNERFSITKEFMEKYDLSETSKLYINFDIEAQVRFIKK